MRGYLVVFTALFLFSGAIHAAPKPISVSQCRKIYDAYQDLLGKQAGISDTNEERRQYKLSTVRITGYKGGRHGGKRVFLKREGPQWSTSYGKILAWDGHYNDAQGDPRWFIENIGAGAAKYFGFEILSETLMTVPDFAELQGALDKVNVELRSNGQEEMDLKFYLQKKDVLVEYNTRFAKEKSIPIADPETDEAHFIHDIGFHGGAPFIPNYIVEYGAARTDYVSQFTAFLRTKYTGSVAVLGAAEFYAHRLDYFQSSNVDNATAAVSPGAAKFARGDSRTRYWNGQPDVNMDIVILALVGSSRNHGAVVSAKTRLKQSLLEHLDSKKQRELAAKVQLKVFNRVLSLEQVKKDVDEFTRSIYVNSGYDFDPSKPFNISVNQAIANMVEKRMNVRNAALRLLQNP